MRDPSLMAGLIFAFSLFYRKRALRSSLVQKAQAGRPGQHSLTPRFDNKIEGTGLEEPLYDCVRLLLPSDDAVTPVLLKA